MWDAQKKILCSHVFRLTIKAILKKCIILTVWDVWIHSHVSISTECHILKKFFLFLFEVYKFAAPPAHQQNSLNRNAFFYYLWLRINRHFCLPTANAILKKCIFFYKIRNHVSLQIENIILSYEYFFTVWGCISTQPHLPSIRKHPSTEMHHLLLWGMYKYAGTSAFQLNITFFRNKSFYRVWCINR